MTVPDAFRATADLMTVEMPLVTRPIGVEARQRTRDRRPSAGSRADPPRRRHPDHRVDRRRGVPRSRKPCLGRAGGRRRRALRREGAGGTRTGSRPRRPDRTRPCRRSPTIDADRRSRRPIRGTGAAADDDAVINGVERSDGTVREGDAAVRAAARQRPDPAAASRPWPIVFGHVHEHSDTRPDRRPTASGRPARARP